ncbi:MAG: hypothetical protein H8D47_00085 [Planctomycetes bacterium]|nr:hypothetical protein [Planctomycetota bacterium]
MAKGKNVLTTGDISKICHVAPRTVAKWFDRGKLKGYLIPCSKDRRIPLRELKKFMIENNIPLDSFPANDIKILIVDSDKKKAKKLSNALDQKNDYETKIASSNFDTGLLLHEFSPYILLINIDSDGIDCLEIAQNIKSKEIFENMVLIGICSHLTQAQKNKLSKQGFRDFIEGDYSTDDVVEKIESAVSMA